MPLDNVKKVMETYVNLYVPQRKEKFNEDTKPVDMIISLILWIVTGFSVYLSFKCNKGFNFVHLLLALFFSPIYIIYQFAQEGFCGLREVKTAIVAQPAYKP